MVFEIHRLNNFFLQSLCISGAIDQLIECLAGEQEDPGSNPRKGELFSLKFILKRK